MSIYSEPAPRTVDRPPGSRRAASTISHSSHRFPAGMCRPRRKLFRHTSDDRLVQLKILANLSNPEFMANGNGYHTIVLYASTLLAHETGAGTNQPAEFPWSQWGGKHARIFIDWAGFWHLPHVYGDRFVRILTVEGGGDYMVQVLDFNPARNRRACQSLCQHRGLLL